MKRARRDKDLLPPGKAAKGQRKPAPPEIGNQIKILEDKINYLMAENHQRFLLQEAAFMILQANAEIGGFEYDLDLIRAARAKVEEYVAKSEAGELTGMENAEIGGFEYDLDLIRAARAKVEEYVAKSEAGELTGMENDEIIAARYAEFKSENFEE